MAGSVPGDQVIVPDGTAYLEVIGSGPLRQACVYPLRSKGTFVCNGATPVVVPYAAMTADTLIDIGLNTVGGTVGAVPALQTVTPGTGFTVAGTAGDTSTYNWQAQKP